MIRCMTTCLSNQVYPAVPPLRELFNSKGESNLINCWASLITQLVKNLPAMQETQVQFLGRSFGEGNDNPLQYSCLENPMGTGAWQAAVHGVTRVRNNLATKSTNQALKWLKMISTKKWNDNQCSLNHHNRRQHWSHSIKEKQYF